MLAGGTTRSINAFSTWSISVLPPSIATEHICPVLRSTINPFPPVYTHAHLWLLPAGLRMPRTRPHELAWPWQPRSGRCQPRQNTHDKGKRGVASLGQADAGLTATSASAPPPPSTAGAAREMDRVRSVMMSSTSPKGGMVNSLVKYKDKY